MRDWVRDTFAVVADLPLSTTRVDSCRVATLESISPSQTQILHAAFDSPSVCLESARTITSQSTDVDFKCSAHGRPYSGRRVCWTYSGSSAMPLPIVSLSQPYPEEA